MNSLKHLKHFHSRFGFGLSFTEYRDYIASAEFDTNVWLKANLRNNTYQPLPSAKKVKPFALDQSMVPKDERQERRKQERQLILDINKEWIREMAASSYPLREKMSLFWHDHFACSPKTCYMASSYLELIRKESLGSFRKLLHGMAKEPAMLLYLNNQQNRKGHPNENFAREVMELFTLGIGHYTEQDIKESARAFTGWSVGKDRTFRINERQHDFGIKTFFEEEKNWSGEEIIDRLLEERRTAEYVSGKIAAFLLGAPPSEELQSALTKAFYESDYRISSVIKLVANNDEFWRDDKIGQDVLSPVELLVRLRRDFGIEDNESNFDLVVQRSLGQVIFQPPNVAGWPSGKEWIDTSTLPTRLSLSRAVLLNQEFKASRNKSFAKGEDLTENLSNKIKRGLAVPTNIDSIEKEIDGMSYAEKTTFISSWFLPDLLLAQNEMLDVISGLHFKGTRGVLALISSLPEYQLK
jgi:uncharacterized protein (DUF1800 family)